MTYYMQIRVRTEHIDNYPELFERYKRGMGEAMMHQYGVEPDWDTFRRMDGRDDPLCLDEEKPFSILVVTS